MCTDNCNCSKCKITVITKRGERGPQGEQGVQGETGPQGPAGEIDFRTFYGSGDANITAAPAGWFDNTPNFVTTNLEHTISVAGIYRYEFNLFFESEVDLINLDTGIRVDGTDPSGDTTRVSLTLGNPQPICCSVVVSLSAGDVVSPDYSIFFSSNESGSLQINGVKIYRTKVG